MKLYEIAQAYRAWEAEIEEAGGEITETMRGLLTQIDEERDEKVESIAKLIRELQAEKQALKDESTRLLSRATSVSNRIDWLKSYVQDTMTAMGVERVEGVLLKVWVQKSPPACQVYDETLLPEKYVQEIVSTKVDRKAIIEDWKSTGTTPDGCEVTQGKTLRIR